MHSKFLRDLDFFLQDINKKGAGKPMLCDSVLSRERGKQILSFHFLVLCVLSIFFCLYFLFILNPLPPYSGLI